MTLQLNPVKGLPYILFRIIRIVKIIGLEAQLGFDRQITRH